MKIFSFILLRCNLWIVVTGLVLISSCSKGGAASQDPVAVLDTPPRSTTSSRSLAYLNSITGLKTVTGQEGMQYWQPMQDISGKYPGLWGEDFSYQPFQGTSSMDGWRSLIVSTAKQRWASGSLIALMFHACPPTQKEPCQWSGDGGVESSLSDDQWTDLITDGTVLNSNWKARLDIIATYLQDLKNNGVEVLFRPFHEMNQGVFWWADRGQMVRPGYTR
jgi:mannan endo-1,4-beta-mannosidase